MQGLIAWEQITPSKYVLIGPSNINHFEFLYKALARKPYGILLVRDKLLKSNISKGISKYIKQYQIYKEQKYCTHSKYTSIACYFEF